MHLQNFYSFTVAFYKILRVLWSVSGGQNCPVACAPCFSFLPHRLPFSSSCKQELGTLWFIAFMVRNHSEPLQAACILLGQPQLFELLLWPLIGQLWPLPVGHVDPLNQYRIASIALTTAFVTVWEIFEEKIMCPSSQVFSSAEYPHFCKWRALKSLRHSGYLPMSLFHFASS